MSTPRSVLTSVFTLLVFLTWAYAHLEKCAVLEFLHLTDNVRIKENDFVNVTFWLNTSGCETSDTFYRMSVKVKTDKNITDDDGRLAVINNRCDVTTGPSLRCVSPAGPVELYSKVNRSHIEIEWKWWWKENGSYTDSNKTLNITACALPRVINLTFNGQETNRTFITDVGQNISIYCAFDKGNPPTTFGLLDRNGGEIDVAKDESHIMHSLSAVSCEEDWPVVRCEGNRSTENKSVSLLIRCPPQFTDVAPKFVYPDVNDHVIFNIKAHSTTLSGCLLTRASTEENLRQKVNCSLHGIPPNLTLNITLHNEVKLIMGNWTLNVTNDIGSGDIVLTFIATSGTTSRLVVIISVLCSAAVLTVAVLIAIQRSKKQKQGKRTRLSASNMDHARESMIVNDLYQSISEGGHVSVVPVRNDSNGSPTNQDLVFLSRPALTKLDVPTLPLHSEPSPAQCNEGETMLRTPDHVAYSDTYVVAADVRKKKKLKKNEISPHGTNTSTYVSILDVQGKKRLRTHDCESPDDELSGNIASTMAMEMAPTSRRKNTKELIYGDLDFSHVTGTDIICDSKGETEYTDINHIAIAPPHPHRDYKKKKTDKK